MIAVRPVVVANEIRLLRSQHSGSFVVVEGRDDRLFLERFAPRAHCRIVVAEGKAKVLEVVRILEQDGFQGVAGLVDADFERVLGTSTASQNILRIDTHDLEAMLLRSRALDGALVEFGSAEKLSVLQRDVRESLLNAALPLGCLRLHSATRGLSLRFDGIRYGAFLRLDDLKVDNEAMIREIGNRSQRHDLSTAELQEVIASLRAKNIDPWELCSGDDLIGCLGVALRRMLGSSSPSAEELRRALRLCVSQSEFQKSTLYSAISDWEHRNAPFRILAG